MRTFIIAFFYLSMLTGCLSISTQTQPPNTVVQPILKGRDCVAIVFGMSAGTNTIARAVEEGRPINTSSSQIADRPVRITRIHSISLDDNYFFMGGNRCITVTGEP